MARRLASIRALPLHPVLLTAAMVLAFWVETAVSPMAALRALAATLAAVVVLTTAAALALHSAQRAGLVVSTLLILLWSKHLVGAIANPASRGVGIIAWVWIGLIAIAALVAGRLLFRVVRGRSVGDVTRAANLVTALLLLSTLVSSFAGDRLGAAAEDVAWALGREPAPSATDPADRPDIYVLLLDMYARGDVLAAKYGLDNTPFYDALDVRGFEVSDSSRSPYPFTHLALPTLLNMAYLPDVEPLAAIFDGTAPLRPTLRRVIGDNLTFAQFRDLGYTVVATNSGFEDYSLRHVERFVDPGQMNEFELQLLESTYLGDILNAAMPDLASGQLRDRITDTLELLPGIAAESAASPRLVFAHIPAPHTPIVFDASGGPVVAPLDSRFFRDDHVARGAPTEAYIAGYAGQVEHLNRLMIDALDGILASSDTPPVIILLSDHGPSATVDWLSLPIDEVSDAEILERSGILFAARTPGHESVFPEDVVLVDVFRHLVDEYFGTDYGIAPAPDAGIELPPVGPAVLATERE